MNLTVPANSSVDVIDKTNSFYLQETDLIRGGASAASTIEFAFSYELHWQIRRIKLWQIVILDETKQEGFGKSMTLLKI